MNNFINQLELIIKNSFIKCGYKPALAHIKLSNFPEVSDFQCNSAFIIAKDSNSSAIDIANNIVSELSQELIFKKIWVVKPGFINIIIDNSYLAKYLTMLNTKGLIENIQIKRPQTIVIDYGGVNVAKAMHVGHLRTAIAGESLKRILRFIGHKVISDIHLGDWGLPMGMLIEELKLSNPSWPYFADNYLSDYPINLTIDDLEKLYPQAANRCKSDEQARNNAKLATTKLQQKDRGYLALWQKFIDISVTDIKKQFDQINVEFDLWLGESSVSSELDNFIEQLKDIKLAKLSNNALIIEVINQSDKAPVPPLILITSEQSYTYAATDLATINARVNNYSPDRIIYIVDKRQALHFEQVFRAASLANITDQNKLTHLGNGTINGADNKPFKTRDGSAMRLVDLIEQVKSQVRVIVEQEELIAKELIDKDEVIRCITIAAIKFADLNTPITANYIFELDKFISFQGCTGPYLLYSAVRMKSLLEKAKNNNLAAGKIIITNQYERALALKICQFTLALEASYINLAAHHLCDFAYKLAQNFSSFYQNCSILKENDPELLSSRISLVELTLHYLMTILDLLGIEVPNRM